MKALFPLAGLLVFLACIGHFVSGFNVRWTLGRYWMPSSIITVHGHFIDGSEVDPVTLAVHRAGIEEETYLVALTVVLLSFAYAARQMQKLHRMRNIPVTPMQEQRPKNRAGGR